MSMLDVVIHRPALLQFLVVNLTELLTEELSEVDEKWSVKGEDLDYLWTWLLHESTALRIFPFIWCRNPSKLTCRSRVRQKFEDKWLKVAARDYFKAGICPFEILEHIRERDCVVMSVDSTLDHIDDVLHHCCRKGDLRFGFASKHKDEIVKFHITIEFAIYVLVLCLIIPSFRDSTRRCRVYLIHYIGCRCSLHVFLVVELTTCDEHTDAVTIRVA